MNLKNCFISIILLGTTCVVTPATSSKTREISTKIFNISDMVYGRSANQDSNTIREVSDDMPFGITQGDELRIGDFVGIEDPNEVVQYISDYDDELHIGDFIGIEDPNDVIQYILATMVMNCVLVILLV